VLAPSCRSRPRTRGNSVRNGVVEPVEEVARVGRVSDTAHDEARRLAEGARDRVRFEEEALDLADQVYSVARHLSGSKEEAEDLVQETYARAFRSWRSFTPGTNLRAWLMRIMTNLNIDRGRRKQRSPDTQPLEEGDYYLYNQLSDALPESNPQEDQVLRRLSQNDAVNALTAVPHDFRDVVVLVDIGDFSYQDAAQILDIPIGTVMSRLHRGRRILKKELADTVVGDGQPEGGE
jgi:RNA polymerase sigma-70 factor, ECF subfamily